jgi:hypothetical protein
MDDIEYFENLEEPPPIRRYVAPAEAPRKFGLLAVWTSRSSGSRASHASADLGPPAQRRSKSTVILALVALVLLGVQGWTVHGLVRARKDLVDVDTRLAEARNSLGLVWESTKRLDADRMARLGSLADSIRAVLEYAQGEVRLWEATYANLGQQLEANARNSAGTLRVVNTRLDGFARADQTQRSRLEVLERQDRTHITAFEALSRRTISQEAATHDVFTMVASLRETLGKVDSGLGRLEQRFASSNSAYGQLGRRVESLAGWADGFRRAGLSGDALQGQLASLADELRRIRVRVDSLRPYARTVMSSDTR